MGASYTFANAGVLRHLTPNPSTPARPAASTSERRTVIHGSRETRDGRPTRSRLPPPASRAVSVPAPPPRSRSPSRRPSRAYPAPTAAARRGSPCGAPGTRRVARSRSPSAPRPRAARRRVPWRSRGAGARRPGLPPPPQLHARAGEARREPHHRVFGEQPLVCRETAEAQVLERVVERELELAPAACLAAPLRLGREPQPHLPQQLAPRQAEAVAPAHSYQMLDRVALELGGCPPHEIAGAPERAAARAFRHDRGRRLLAPVPDEPEPHPHASPILSHFPGLQPATSPAFNRTPHVARVHAREPDLDRVALGVPPQRVE